jgi:hypothetical protein
MKRAKISSNGTNKSANEYPILWDAEGTADDASIDLEVITTPDEVSQLIARLKDDPSILRQADIQEQLRSLGKSRLDRYLLTQQMERAGLNYPRELWHILDTSEETITPRLTFTEAKQLAEHEGDERLVDNLLVLRGFSILGADAKAGKSTLAKNLMASVLKGEPWLGRDVMSGSVLYYLLEESMSEVIADMEALGVDEDDSIHFRRGKIAVEHFVETLKGDIEATGAILAVIDPLVDILGVENVNDYRLVNRALKELVHAARDTGCHVMAIHHNTKGGNSHSAKDFLGSAAIGAATDANFILQKDRYGTRFISCTTRYRRDVDIPRTVLDYDPISGRVTLGLEANEHEDSKLTKEEALRQSFLTVLGEYERLSTTELDAKVKKSVSAHQTVVQEVREELLAEGVITKEKVGNTYFWLLVDNDSESTPYRPKAKY